MSEDVWAAHASVKGGVGGVRSIVDVEGIDSGSGGSQSGVGRKVVVGVG